VKKTDYLCKNNSPMTFDNSLEIKIQRLGLFAASLIILAYFVLTYFERLIKFPLLGMSDTAWTVILVIAYILVVFLPMLRNYQFIYFSDEGENIIFRYFESGIFGGRKNSVEIDKKSFAGYKTESSFLGLKQSIILFQKFREGVAKYPPIYISALTRKQKAEVYKSLKSLSPDM
jgi:hypothetical protein